MSLVVSNGHRNNVSADPIRQYYVRKINHSPGPIQRCTNSLFSAYIIRNSVDTLGRSGDSSDRACIHINIMYYNVQRKHVLKFIVAQRQTPRNYIKSSLK